MESVRWAQAVSQDSAAQREMKDFHSQSYRRVINGEECERSIETRSEVIFRYMTIIISHIRGLLAGRQVRSIFIAFQRKIKSLYTDFRADRNTNINLLHTIAVIHVYTSNLG